MDNDCNPKQFPYNLTDEASKAQRDFQQRENNLRSSTPNERLNDLNSQRRSNLQRNVTFSGVNQNRNELLNYKKELFRKKQKAKNCKPLDRLKAALKQQLCRCPTCSPLNVVVGKVAGKNYFKIPINYLYINA